MSTDESKAWVAEKGWTEQRNAAIEQNRETNTTAVVSAPTPAPIPQETTTTNGELTISQIAEALNKEYFQQLKAVLSNNQVIIYQNQPMPNQRGPMTIKESEDCFILSPVFMIVTFRQA